MFNSRKPLAFLSLAFLFLAPSLLAQDSFKVPPLKAAVNDYAGMLSHDVSQQLAQGLTNFNHAGGAQIVVLTVEDLGGLPIEQASIQITDQWKLGSAKGDDGVLLLISKNDRKIRIEVGQGMEGNLPDAIAKRIIDQVIQPAFRAQDYDQGIVSAVYQIAQRTNPDIEIAKFLQGQRPESRQVKERRGGFPPLYKIIFYILLFGFLVFTPFGRLILFSSLLSGGGRGGGGWGGGGGGFGGGGGGRFSGGGASGGW